MVVDLVVCVIVDLVIGVFVDLVGCTNNADIIEGDCYLHVPPDPGTVAAALAASASAAPGACAATALGASASAAPGAGTSPPYGTPPTASFHTFTLDSGASRSFFRDSTMLTPLSRPVAVSLADPSGGPVLANYSTVLPCPTTPSGLLSGLHLPSFSTNLVSGADLQDAWVDQFTPGGQRVTHCTCSRTGRHLATFTHRPGSSLYTLTTAPPPISVSSQVAASSQVFAAASKSSPASAPCSCRPLAHETLLWHHRLGHPSLPRLRGMASRALVSGLPRSLPPLPPGPAPTCVPCVEGRQRAAPHSSSFPPTEAPLQTLHMDVWGPARVCGQGQERYFLLVVDDYSRYTTVFPLHSKGEVTEVLIDWIRGARRQLSESFGSDLPVLRLHSDRGGEFSSDLLRAFCRLEGIRQTFTLPASPQQNGIAERRIGMVMDVARTSMIHAAAPHFLWPFALLSAILPRTSCPSVPFPVSSLASPLTHPGGGSTTSPRVVSCPLKTSRSTSVSQVDPAEPVEVAVDSGAESGGAAPAGTEAGGAQSGRTEPGGAAPTRAASGGALGVLPRREPLSPQRLREWYSRLCQGTIGASGGAAGAAGGAAGAGGATGAAGGAAGAGGATGAAGGAAGSGGAAGAGAAGGAAAGAVGGAGGAAGIGDPEAEGTGPVSAVSGGVARPRPYYVPLLQQVLSSPPSPGPPHFLSPPPVRSQSQLQPASPLLGPSPYSGPTRGLTERRQPESRPVSPASRAASPVRTARAGRVSRPRLPLVLGTHSMTLRPSTAPRRVPLPSPPASSLPDGPDPESDSLRAASPTVTRFLATAVTDPLFESFAASALSVSASVCPPSVGGECALGTDVLEDRQEDLECFAAASPHLVSMLLAPEGDPDALDIPTPRSYAEAIEGPYSSQWQAAMDAEMASWNPMSGESRCLMVQQVLQRFGFTYSSPQSTPLPTGHSLSAPPSDESVELSGLYPELVGCLMYLMTCTRPDLAYPLSLLARYVAPGRHRKVHWDAAKRVLRYLCSTSGMGLVLGGRARFFLTGHADVSWVDDFATQRSSQGYTFSLGSGSVSWRSTRSSSVLSSSCEAEIYVGAMAAQELRWLTYLLADLGEVPRSPPILYVDNKAMLALCQEHRLEHRTKHISLRYFLARELQQCGQLHLAYVASQANTADVFTKALQPCDHQRFCTVLGLVPTVPHLLTS
ncbi:unnamed protein product [Closterium sp. NIES-54]